MTVTARPGLAVAALAIAAALVGCREQPANPRVTPVTTPIPESSRPGRAAKAPSADGSRDKPEETPTPGAADPRATHARFDTPGTVRWTLEFDRRVDGIDWFPFGGLAISAGAKLHNVTSRGIRRWSLVAGSGHRFFRLGDQPVIWSAEFARIFQVGRRGQAGWKRDWSAGITDDPRGGFLLVDAATVAALGPDGKDRWRVSLEGLRRLRGPFPCEEGLVFQGVRGLESTAVTISDRGMVLREIALERGSLLLGSGPGCEPLVWRNSEVALLDQRGVEKWRRALLGEPLVRPLEGGFLLVSGDTGGAIEGLALAVDGREIWSEELPVSGRIVGLDALAARGGRPTVLGLCLDVSSPCARPGENRGPYNTLLSPGADGRLRVLARHVQGHLAVAPHLAGGLVVAGSSAADAVEVARRNEDDIVGWQITLPGRLCAGPFVGPSGEIYVATCMGWDCAPPFGLTAISGEPPPARQESSSR